MKRAMDLIFSIIGLAVLSPLFLVVSVAVSIDSPGGPFFMGPRVGQHGRVFKIIKFRSMKQGCEGKGKWNVSDKDGRITKAGHFLRKTKIDEIAQLINVLKGDMSFVGPRPELPHYVAMYTDKEKPILDLKPGITDWASIVNFEQFKGFTKAVDPDKYYLEVVRPLKLRLQLYYRYHHSIASDIRCVCWTVYKVFTHSQRLPGDVQKIVDEYRKGQKNTANKERQR